jgi:hypothetical protein
MIPLWRGDSPPFFLPIGPHRSAQLIGYHAKEVILVKRWLPLILLIVFTVISMAALSAVAKNIAQKRTIFGDPLCKIVWKKTYQVGRNASPAKKLKSGTFSRMPE